MRYIKKILLGFLALMVGVSLNAGVAFAEFNQNRIIDDVIFNDVGSMSAQQVDDFLNERQSCISSNSGFRAIDPIGYNPAEGFLYGGNVTAGTVIAHAAQAYDLNPKVLLVTLQKEQSLITTKLGDSNCNTRTISKAMGYACTDTYQPNSYSGVNLYTRNGVTYTSVDLTCVESVKKVGFTQQIIRASWMLKYNQQRSLGNINWAIVRGTWDNSDDLDGCYSGLVTEGWRQVCPSGATIYYDGRATIDNTTVHLDTGATAALYRYTPHFNGNRNFVSIWEGWFGSTIYTAYSPMAAPRWMEMNKDSYKIDSLTSSNVDFLLAQGRQIKFVDKTTTTKGTCLRTAFDAAVNIRKCVLLSDLGEISPTYQVLPESEQMRSPMRNLYKQSIITDAPEISTPLTESQPVRFAAKTTVGGRLFYIPQADYIAGRQFGVLASDSYPSSSYGAIEPKAVKIKADMQKVSPLTGQKLGDTLKAGVVLQVTSNVVVSGRTYYRTAFDTSNNFDRAIPSDSTTDLFESFLYPRWMTVKEDTKKINPLTGEYKSTVSKGQQVYFNSKTTLPNGITYYRSQSDTQAGLNLAIPASSVSDISLSKFLIPRWLEVKTSATMKNPITGVSGKPVSEGQQLYFTKKVTVNGIEYFVSEAVPYENGSNAIPATSTKEIQFTAMDNPRYMRVKETTSKTWPITGNKDMYNVTGGLVVFFTEKITVNNKVYLRTKFDTTNDYQRGIGIELLEER